MIQIWNLLVGRIDPYTSDEYLEARAWAARLKPGRTVSDELLDIARKKLDVSLSGVAAIESRATTIFAVSVTLLGLVAAGIAAKAPWWPPLPVIAIFCLSVAAVQ